MIFSMPSFATTRPHAKNFFSVVLRPSNEELVENLIIAPGGHASIVLIGQSTLFSFTSSSCRLSRTFSCKFHLEDDVC